MAAELLNVFAWRQGLMLAAAESAATLQLWYLRSWISKLPSTTSRSVCAVLLAPASQATQQPHAALFQVRPSAL
jgi:hypothetical protein